MALKEIVPGLFQISLGMVNAFLIDSDDGLTLIDTGIAGSSDKILQAIRTLGKQPADIQHILVTHCHGDHTGSLAELKEKSGAPAYMHPEDAALVRVGQSMRPLTPAPNLIAKILFRLFANRLGDDTITPAEIEQEVTDGQLLPIAGGLTAIHVPGHCAGQLAFLWPQHGGVLFVADAAANIIRLGWSFVYEDLAEGKRSLAKLAGLEFETACFGHGKAIVRDASERFRQRWLLE
jgi:glyoxylase-like metal-dependent hydrolase (beta-lactamase superfamily II)